MRINRKRKQFKNAMIVEKHKTLKSNNFINGTIKCG